MKTFWLFAFKVTLVVSSFNSAAVESPAAVWHCSRLSDTESQSGELAEAESQDTFQLATSGMNMDAIGISLMDLMDAYSGKAILVNGQPLTACFMPGETPLSDSALKALGLNPVSMQQQARKSAIVQSNLHMVTSESDMLACISKRFPAVGYLSTVAENERVVPCF